MLLIAFFRGLLVLGLVTSLHGLKKGSKNRARLGKGSGPEDTTFLYLDSKIATPTLSVSSVANRSLSPWTFRNSHVKNRFPEYIAQAQCQMSGCLTPDGREDLSMESKPILYQILVLHRVEKDDGRKEKRKKGNVKKNRKGKRYFYTLKTEIVTVGCTCVRPIQLPHY
ncbi:interleukin 17a/f3 [Esox lucius]|uniref:interleukin 17a/f3 n=1 Tax=Esox lucius TaxID=8010 RepID=UPI0005773920|nr:interleukin 17a/f3 [Esox lucius]